MNNFEYALPTDVSEVFQYLNTADAIIKAGGVDIVDLMKEELITPKRLVNIRALPELLIIKEDTKRGLLLGPNIILADLAANQLIRNSYQALAQAAADVATPQIRNLATLGGNLCQRPRCWYFRNIQFPCARKRGNTCYSLDGENQYHAIFANADGCAIVHPSGTAVALTALDARLQIENGRDPRQEVAIENFFITPAQDITRENILKQGELITEINIPLVNKKYKSYYFKQKEKQSFDWSIAEVAVALQFNGKLCRDARIVLGSAAPVPWRVKSAEDTLKETTITRTSARKAAEIAMKGAEPFELNSYKIRVFKAIIYRTICWTAGIDPLQT
jgi:xanthine dehydrogenase YagS FAD-binding subunit